MTSRAGSYSSRTNSSQNCDNLNCGLAHKGFSMETALVFPYFLARFLSRAGLCDFDAEFLAVLLSSICLVSVVCAPFHSVFRIKLTMAGIAWAVVVLAAAGCVWECEDSKQRKIRNHADHTDLGVSPLPAIAETPSGPGVALTKLLHNRVG